MLKLEDQVCSLKLAKRLKELNCKQESLWYWSKFASGNGKSGSISKARLLPNWEIQPELTEKDGIYRYSAFTIPELIEECGNWTILLWGCKLHGYYASVSPCNQELEDVINAQVEGKTPLEAMAKLYIKLIQ